MAIKKQEFYEGAAIHRLARMGHISQIRYEPPFFFLNGKTSVLLKYSTKSRSPWGFTFTIDEQHQLNKIPSRFEIAIGLICGADGVAAIDYESFCSIAAPRRTSIHIACYRNHGEHYEVSGPDGTLERKIAPSAWQRLLSQ